MIALCRPPSPWRALKFPLQEPMTFSTPWSARMVTSVSWWTVRRALCGRPTKSARPSFSGYSARAATRFPARFDRTRRSPPCLVHGRDVAPPPAPELGVLDPNRCHHAVDHRLSRLARTRHREQVRIVHGRAEGHVDALEDPREVAADGKHRSHPVDRDGNHPRPGRKDEEPRAGSPRPHETVPRPGALRKESHRAPGQHLHHAM